MNSELKQQECWFPTRTCFFSWNASACRLRAVPLFSVFRRAKSETRKWPRAWLMARAAPVSRVSRLRCSRARVLLSLNLKKKRACSQSILRETASLKAFVFALLCLFLFTCSAYDVIESDNWRREKIFFILSTSVTSIRVEIKAWDVKKSFLPGKPIRPRP